MQGKNCARRFAASKKLILQAMQQRTNQLTALLVILLAIAFQSCTIQKRQHLKGYYVNWHAQSAQPKQVKLEAMPIQAIKQLPDSPAANQLKTALKPRIDKPHTQKQINGKQPVLGPPEKKKNPTANPANVNTKTTSKTKVKFKTLAPKTMENTQPTPAPNQRKAALLTGFSLVLMTILAALAAPVIQGIYVAGNAVATAANLSLNLAAFNASIWGWVGIFVLDILVSIGVYAYYKKIQPKLAKITGVLRFIYTAFLGVAIAQLFLVNTSQSAILTLSKITAFNNWWGWGLIVFGFHLITLALLFKNENNKKWVNLLIRTLLIIAGIGYIGLYVGLLIVPNPLQFKAAIEPFFILPMVLGEFLFALYMLISGGKKAAKTE